jgi:hypothetical protein
MYPVGIKGSEQSGSSAGVWEIMVAGGGGGGWEVVSSRKCMKESTGRDGSVWMENKDNGSLPVDENKDTISGCTDVENMTSNF